MLDKQRGTGEKKAGRKQADKLVADIQATRAGICKAFLVSLAILAVPALAASLYRVGEIGWKPVMLLHSVLGIAIWTLSFLRNRVPFHYQAGFIVVMFFVIGLGGILQFGLMAGGTVFLAAAGPIATLLFGGRVGTITLLMVFGGAVVTGFLVVSGSLNHNFDVAAYAVAPSSWLTSIFGWMLASGALTASLHVFNSNLINSLKISREHEEALREHQLSLEKTIEERDSSNRELQKALAEIKTLRGILPICSYCHNIRDDEGAWSEMENYLAAHSQVQFSHGICPQCVDKARAEAGLGKGEG